MFGSATFSADYLKGPSLPLRYTELAVRIRRRVILSTVGSVTLTHTSGPRESVVGALHRAGVCFVWCGNGSFLPRYERACFRVLTFFPPVTPPLSSMKSQMLAVCFPHGPGLYVGHSSSDRKRTPLGVYSFGSCIIILYRIQTLGGKSLPRRRWHSDGEPVRRCSENAKEPFSGCLNPG